MRKMWRLFQLLFTLLLLTGPSQGWSQAPAVRGKKVETPPPTVSGAISVTRSTSLYDLKNGKKADGLNYVFSGAYRLSTGSLSSKLGYTQDLNDSSGESSDWEDSNLTYSHNALKSSAPNAMTDVAWVPSATAIVPLSKKSREVDQLQTALIAGLGLKLSAGDRTNLKGLSLGLGVTAGQNFHAYETNKNGESLNRNSSNLSADLQYEYQPLTFAVNYIHRIRWPYAGETRQSFEWTEEISWSFLKRWSATVGHSNSGASLKPNQQDSNIAVVDENNSVVYLGLGCSF